MSDLKPDRTSARYLRLIALWFLVLFLSLANTQQVFSSPQEVVPVVRLPTCTGCYTISGSPLSIVVGKDASYQVYFNGSNGRLTQVYQPLFDEADSGLFVKYGGWIIGPDFWNHLTSAANAYDPWVSTSQSGVSGSGTSASPWFIDTKVEHSASGVKMTARTTYVNGSSFFRLDWDICTPQSGPVVTYLAADFYMQGGDRDPSYGVYDSSSGAVGAANPGLTWLQSFSPITSASRHFAGAPRDLWAAIGAQGAPGPGFQNTVNGSAIDTGAGLQWNLNISGCARVSSLWQFGGSVASRSSVFVPHISR